MKNLVWFRNDLRTDDQKALAEACSQNKPLLAIYFFDPRQYAEGDFGFKKTERFRAQFLIESVKNLKVNLEKLNISLFVFYQEPEEIFPDFIKKHNVDSIYAQKEWTRDEREVFESVTQKSDQNTRFLTYFDQFLYHPDDIPYTSYSDIPRVFTQMRKRLENESEVRKVISKPNAFPKENLIENETSIPTLKDLGLSEIEPDSRTAFPFKGGEDEALKRIEHYFWQTKKLSTYKKTRNGLVGADYSSKLSAWLANGSISARTIYHHVKAFEAKYGENDSTYWLIFELIWRDFFKYVSLKHGDAIFQQGGILNQSYNWNTNKAALNSWINGTTDYNFVNANMVEIAKTGFMSNRGRQNVASYWAKELEQDWRIGAAYFESMLIDYDVHSNWGNWMYNSGVGNDPRDRKFNIQTQAKRYDANGDYQKLWLQEELF